MSHRKRLTDYFLTCHCVSFARSCNAIAEEEAVATLDESFDQRLSDGCETFVLGRVDVEYVLEDVLRAFAAQDSEVDGAFRCDERNGAGRDHLNAGQVGFALHRPNATENLNWISY